MEPIAEPVVSTGVEVSRAEARRAHGTRPVRGLEEVAHSPLYQGRFGRMFRKVCPFLPPDEDLIKLAARMFEEEGLGIAPVPESAIPAGFTYLGQFLDHDITFDPTSRLQRENDPNALRNFRTPRFDLDSLYGAGPQDSPFLYDRNRPFQFLIKKVHGNEEDLPRNSQGRALIGDPRNDENLILSQLHLVFLKLHNRVYDDLAGEQPDPELRFEAACEAVRFHYQWIVVHEFLHCFVGQPLIDSMLRRESHDVATATGLQTVSKLSVDLKHFRWKNDPFMPVEFAAAAFRFGHSLVRPEYDLNDEIESIRLFGPDLRQDLRGFRRRPANRRIDWALFFALDEAKKPQKALRIDTRLARGLHLLPGFGPPDSRENPPSLAERNLRRGKALGLPSGQSVARAMGLPEDLILTDAQLAFGDLEPKFRGSAPLWYYILKEAEVHGCGGERLGPMGGRIVAEVLLGLLAGDPSSYLNRNPNFRPRAGRFGAPADEQYGMADLIRYAQGG